MKYYQIIKDMSNKFNFRFSLVRYALQNDISEAAREYKTTRKTVRKRIKTTPPMPLYLLSML